MVIWTRSVSSGWTRRPGFFVGAALAAIDLWVQIKAPSPKALSRKGRGDYSLRCFMRLFLIADTPSLVAGVGTVATVPYIDEDGVGV
jgi:hypothetical protein